MTIKEAISARHTVYNCFSKPLPADVIKALNDRIDEKNKKYNLNMSLMTVKNPGNFTSDILLEEWRAT